MTSCGERKRKRKRKGDQEGDSFVFHWVPKLRGEMIAPEMLRGLAGSRETGTHWDLCGVTEAEVGEKNGALDVYRLKDFRPAIAAWVTFLLCQVGIQPLQESFNDIKQGY